MIVDNIGLPARTYNLAFTDGSTIGVNDGVILVALKEGHAPTADYVAKLRAGPAGRVPGGDVLFPARRYRDADPEFRPSGADRRAHRRLRPHDEPRRRQGTARSGSLPFPASSTPISSRKWTRPAFYATIDRARAAQLGLNAITDRQQHQYFA